MNSSGFYGADVATIIKDISRFVERHPDE